MKHCNYAMPIGAVRNGLVRELIKCLKKHNGSYEWKPKDAPIVCIENSEFFGTIYVEKIYITYMGEDEKIYLKGTYCDSEFDQDEFDVSDVLPCCLSMIMDALPEPQSLPEMLQDAYTSSMKVYKECMDTYKECMNTYKECMDAYKEWINIYNNREDITISFKEITDFIKQL